MKIRLIIAVTLVLLTFLFAVQNAATVDLRFLFWSVEFPRSLLIFLVLLIGMMIGWFLRSILRIMRSSSERIQG
jgi:uncharacterized integral membrane protein